MILAAALAVVASGCTSSGPSGGASSAGTAGQTTSAASAADSPTQSTTSQISESGSIALTSTGGYTATINYSVSASGFSASPAKDASGFSTVTFKVDAKATVTNTTSGRPNPEPYDWSPLALYPINSAVCTLGKGLLNNASSANEASAALPGLTTSDGGAPAYCALQLTNDLSFGPGPSSSASPAPLAPGQTEPLVAAPSPVSTPGTIPKVPQASVGQLVAGLAQPAKIVYQVTYIQDGPAVQKPAGESCSAYLYTVPGASNTTSAFVISVPAKYAGVCSSGASPRG
ncbi:hypothetical protein [Sinomonas humi]|uniref:Uncharacterized protein n=1 Tax=Sinomonas humi TaxID=1338436 RepID=A0A0B2AF23_9MICC|nr:hypothetical protein [Sinomonas humi]KHL00458.1 hypothetical protein LK10_19865 [Sinomonas humi]